MERDQATQAELLQAAFDRLPDELRQTLYLVRVEGLTYEEVAVKLGITTRRVERRIASALVRLDRDLERLKWQEWRRWT